VLFRSVGEMEYNGRPFSGLEAFCLMRREKRVFNVDRILEITAAVKQPA
jgi:ATP-dependent DNA helicase PIF1